MKLFRVISFVILTSLPVFAAKPVPLRTHPRPMTQNLGQTNGIPTTTKSRSLDSLAPIRYGLDSINVEDLSARSDLRTKLFARMKSLQEAVNSAVHVDDNGLRPSTDAIIDSLVTAARNDSRQLNADLSNMLIAALVSVDMSNGHKTHIWSYRRLFNSADGVTENWGPEIEVAPGEVLFIPVLNLLNRSELQKVSYDPLELKNEVPSGTGVDGTENAPSHFDVTNLHTHGLNVSPQWPSDDIFRSIRPYQIKFYIYQIPNEHPAGTFFYHPHQHGSVATQVAGGMAGALIVRDESKGLDELGTRFGWPKSAEKTLLFQQLSLYENSTTQDYFCRPDFFALKDVGPWTDDNPEWVLNCTGIRQPIANIAEVIQDNTKVVDRGVSTWVSGRLMPDVFDAPIKKGDVRRFRLIHSGVEANVTFHVNLPNSAPANTELPRIQVIARDGIPLPEPYDVTTDHPLVISPGNRADVLVGVDAAATFSETIRYEICTLDDAGDSKAIAYLKVAPDVATTPGQFVSPEEAKRIYANQSASGGMEHNVPEIVGAPAKTEDFKMTFADAKVDANGAFTAGTFHLNGEAFPGTELGFMLNQPAKLSFSVGLLVGGDGQDTHPLHIHVNPFRVPAATSAEMTTRKERGLPTTEFWADTLLVHNGDAPVEVIMPFERWTGRFVSHCHILDHEDGGMMNTLRIDAGSVIPELPLPEVMDLTSMPGYAVNQLKQEWPDVGSILPVTGNVPTIVVFMPKVEEGACPHCTDSVAAVASLREQADAPDFRLWIVSSGDGDSLPSPGTLKLKSGDILFSDVNLHLFEAVGLIDGTPELVNHKLTFPHAFQPSSRTPIHDEDVMHGLFIVSPDGFVFSARRGFMAFDDTQQILKEASLSYKTESTDLQAELERGVDPKQSIGISNYSKAIDFVIQRRKDFESNR